jgi:hypothetical protein
MINGVNLKGHWTTKTDKAATATTNQPHEPPRTASMKRGSGLSLTHTVPPPVLIAQASVGSPTQVVDDQYSLLDPGRFVKGWSSGNPLT